MAEENENNDEVEKIAKKILKAIYKKNDSFSIKRVSSEDMFFNISNVTRLVAWAIGVAFNSDNKNWLGKLEESLNRESHGQS